MGQNNEYYGNTVCQQIICILQKVLQTTGDAIGQVTQGDWLGFCQSVESMRKQDWEKDGILTDAVDSILMTRSCCSDNKGNTSFSKGSPRIGLTPTRKCVLHLQ
jgi:hypothetical protein